MKENKGLVPFGSRDTATIACTWAECLPVLVAPHRALSPGLCNQSPSLEDCVNYALSRRGQVKDWLQNQ